MREVMCNMGNCLEIVSNNGVSVTLRTKDRNDAQRAVFCCASHAALAMLALAQDRGEPTITDPVPTHWKVV